MSKESLLDYWRKSGIITDEKVLKAFKEVPREDFVLEKDGDAAYADHPLHIGGGQTISQPTTVMIMTQALELKEGMKVLEVGAGSGYQAALISRIIGSEGRIITVEFLESLYSFAKKNLKDCSNVKVVKGDGSKGYEKEAPYDRIIVTCAAPSIPPPLFEQLRMKGIIVIPVGSLYTQKMIKAKKTKKGIDKKDLGSFAFVPLRGEYGFKT